MEDVFFHEELFLRSYIKKEIKIAAKIYAIKYHRVNTKRELGVGFLSYQDRGGEREL